MAKEEVVINTRLGERTVTRDRVIHFPKGLIGFEKHREFVLLQIREDSPFMMLQCVSDSGLGLIVTDPYSFLKGYRINVGDAEQKILDIQEVGEMAILVTVAIPHGNPEETTLNLTGPILVNTRNRVGLQVPQTDPRFPGNLRLSDLNSENAEEQG